MTLANAIDEIEQSLGVVLPGLYKRLSVDGMLTAPEAETDASGALLGSVLDFIPLALDEVLSTREEMEMVFNVAVDEHRFVPFARTEQGDHICFYFGGADGEDVPVVLLPNDEDDAHIKARNLEDYVFRTLLETASTAAANGVDEARTQFLAMVSSHTPYLSADRTRLLLDIGKAETKKNAKSLLAAAQAKRLIKEQMAFERLNKEFCYTH